MKPRKKSSGYEQVPMLNAVVDNITMDELVDQLNEGTLLTLNVEMLAKLQKDKDFYDLLPEFDFITCDSQVMYFISKILGKPFKERVSGSDFFPRFYMHHKDNPDITICICGGAPDVAKLAQERINEKAGREIVVATVCPPIGFDKDDAAVDAVLNEINQSKATVLMIALGSGRQEKFFFKYRDRLESIKLFLPLGGTVDYESGTFPRPAPWVTNIGLEWAYRLFKEPKQRWNRYVVQEPPVLINLLKQWLGIYKDPFAE
ncbi:WecB/TagA/CpsF family glycosyltransferase [Halioxenophilus sp. WMMB6]|uniref:WecB/TagA/CpsF family glycosyltransferase n=1 Tax=Halioxenophilus sp. WMMB6 TaxID=3073815 RepID=UPI00295EC7E6|nr:WecB/TagA/CpsF family glycosyltransferase [Halioxenophilus sp. WMMB6]